MQFNIRRFDIYRKVPKDLTQPTTTGACISIISCLIMASLFAWEIYDFIDVDLVSELLVDDPVAHAESIPVIINVTLPRMRCEFLGIDIQDDLGRHDVGFVDDTTKTPINDEKGCIFAAKFFVNKVPGNFHVSTHSSDAQPEEPDMAHRIHQLTFGSYIGNNTTIPGSFNPLQNKDATSESNEALLTHEYFLKVVPTVYEHLNGHKQFPYQYTFSYRSYLQMGHGHGVMPAIWFRYELTPISVKYIERRKPIYGFITTLFAIIGGTFTVVGIIDSCIFSAAEVIKKIEIGKQT
ncbi:endoplasmic reticulum-Golgi intermediate compartment protein 1-like [Tubulanus polymorphus]|uniref:endoplasmic reticulum-Golgi intermediate compartment protein 1-like n=1 Tax=Tubulanus polymorphus TaxID=672921 RepID=UPI003DA483D4